MESCMEEWHALQKSLFSSTKSDGATLTDREIVISNPIWLVISQYHFFVIDTQNADCNWGGGGGGDKR